MRILARAFQLLTVLLCVVALAGCEGDEGPVGPTGPTGPPGPSVVICFGEINGEVDPADVVYSWPSDVMVSVVDSGTGIWNVTLTGTFPSTQGTVLTTNVDTNVARSLTGYITSWSTTTIAFRVGIWNIPSSVFINGEFSFIILAEE